MNRTEYLLTCLIEECSEVQKAATKALRFGVNSTHPHRTETHGEEIKQEFVDVTAIMEMLINEGVIQQNKPVAEDISNKINKVEYHMYYGGIKDVEIKLQES